jgi:hypothetical protein
MVECLTIGPIPSMKARVYWRSSFVCQQRYFCSFPAAINRAFPQDRSSVQILHKATVGDERDAWKLQIFDTEIRKGTFEHSQLRPTIEMMIDRFSRPSLLLLALSTSSQSCKRKKCYQAALPSTTCTFVLSHRDAPFALQLLP